MTHDHPWRRLRGLPHVTVVWRRMAGRLGATNGTDMVVLHPDQLQVQRRSTLAHELAHIDLGHVDGCTGAEERHAARLAARRLVPLERLGDALVWSQHLDEVADVLWVDRATLDARIESLHPAEWHYLQQRIDRADPAA